MSAIISSQFEDQELRFVGTAEVPEWVGLDAVNILYPQSDKRNRSNYLKKVPNEWKGVKKIMTLGGEQEVVMVFEPGLYYLIARSNSPVAIPFQKRVFEDILPAIRKTGSYGIPQPQLPSSYDDRVLVKLYRKKLVDRQWTGQGKFWHYLYRRAQAEEATH